jgi:hypothetical protein
MHNITPLAHTLSNIPLTQPTLMDITTTASQTKTLTIPRILSTQFFDDFYSIIFDKFEFDK